MKTKICKKCLQNKPVEEFNKHYMMKDGLTAFCKVCYNIQQKERYQSKKEKMSK